MFVVSITNGQLCKLIWMWWCYYNVVTQGLAFFFFSLIARYRTGIDQIPSTDWSHHKERYSKVPEDVTIAISICISWLLTGTNQQSATVTGIPNKTDIVTGNILVFPRDYSQTVQLKGQYHAASKSAAEESTYQPQCIKQWDEEHAGQHNCAIDYM